MRKSELERRQEPRARGVNDARVGKFHRGLQPDGCNNPGYRAAIPLFAATREGLHK